MSNTTAIKRTANLPGTAAKNLTPGDTIDYFGTTYRVTAKAISADLGNGFRDIALTNTETGEQSTITMPSSYRFTVIEEPAEQTEAAAEVEALETITFDAQQYAGSIEDGTVTPRGTVKSHRVFRNHKGRWVSRITYTSGEVDTLDYHAIVATDR